MQQNNLFVHKTDVAQSLRCGVTSASIVCRMCLDSSAKHYLNKSDGAGSRRHYFPLRHVIERLRLATPHAFDEAAERKLTSLANLNAARFSENGATLSEY